MGFWEEHEAREADMAPPAPPSAQDAPERCLECDHVGTDVFFGSCADCFQRWEETCSTPE